MTGSVGTELARCCVCGTTGRTLARRPPWAIVQCPVCGLRFTSPRPDAAARRQLYDDPRYHGSGGTLRRRGAPPSWLTRIWTDGRLAELRSAAPAPAAVLEIGAGSGEFAIAAAALGHRLTAVEPSQPVAARLRAAGIAVVADLADAPPGPVDVVCCWDTLEHLSDPVTVLRDVRARLGPGGVLLLTVPAADSVPARLLGGRWWGLKPEQHLWHFTETTVRLVAARAGLVVTRVHRGPARRAVLVRPDALVAVVRPLPDPDPDPAGSGGPHGHTTTMEGTG
ncbi:class I SAM-dependent methyltransferase [Nakamurella leprariae]|uniref:class I SAM-dependent methyltransferase n=1 Tax=Nakamurella leprariae TaxID=2803911 RepID=UPI002E2AB814|nr:class I SAM-dependent methyltransferase [Nakamurella leprariae]